MAIEILIFAGSIDGDLPLKSSHTAYKGGMAAKMTSTGLDVATTYASVIGFFKNDSATVDDISGPQVNDAAAGPLSGAVVFGANKVRLTQAAAGQVFAFPPTANTGTWVENDEIYVKADGTWDNAAANGGDPPQGRVVKAPTSATDDMHVYQYPRAPKI